MATGQYALGRHLTTVALTPLTPDPTTGIFSPGATIVITGIVEELDQEEFVTLEEIGPITSPRGNEVAVMYGSRLRVAEILTRQASVAGTVGPQLPLLRNTFIAGSGHCLIEWTHGGNTNDKYGVYGGMRGPFRGKGKQVFMMSFGMVDNGVPDWVYA